MTDLLIHGGPIYTLDGNRPPTEALLIRDDRIVAVGTEAEVRPLVTGTFEDIALKGRAVVPGLTDAHIHLLWTGLGRRTVVAPAATDDERTWGFPSWLEE